MKLFRLCTILFVILFAKAATAEGKSGSDPPAYREIFEMSLERTSGYLLTAHGRTVIETRTDCRGTRTLQRSVADMTYKDGQPVRTDFVIDTWESRDGRTLRFHTRNSQSDNDTEHHDGVAKLAADGSGEVKLTPPEKPFSLPRGTTFPIGLSHAILEAAVKGHDPGSRTVFQGGDRKAFFTAIIKVGRRLRNASENAKDRDNLLKPAAAWPILISYFPAQEELPASEVATTLFENGLLGSFSLVYPWYTLRAKLVRVDRLPSSC